MTDWRKDYIWNTLAGIINAAEAVIMSMAVTRYGRLADAGILSLAFATGNVLMTVGKFGGRMYQVTDVSKQHTFRMYLTQRFLTIGLMALSLCAFLIYRGYVADKRNAIIIIAVIYMIEALEDCFWGKYQAAGRLYVGAQMFTSRWMSILIVFALFMVVTGDMNRSLFAGGAAGCIVFVGWIIALSRIEDARGQLAETYTSANKSGMWLRVLFRQTAPLFVAAFCAMFTSNIPKFAIDQYMTDEVQACYGFVAMPVFVIGMLNQFIYQPTVVPLTDKFYAGEIKAFRKDVRGQMIIVSTIMAACVIGAGMAGIPILSFIYNADLSDYWRELVILQFAGGFLAMSGYFTVLLTLMRKQNMIQAGYVTALITGIIILNMAVKTHGTLGASMGYLVVMMLLFAFYLASYLRIITVAEREG